MTPDQIEAERTKFEAWFAREVGFGHKPTWIPEYGYLLSSANGMWRDWFCRAEEQYASQEAAEETIERHGRHWPTGERAE